ncbi:MAG: PQQ-dependent sugar dehydrogenase [Pseudomonadota bacterium]|uniref:PQQ-dependent sugar dehydrogenase n=1 Tax=Thermithiobacillus tepidarius TaxID=929 RepID=UPI00040FFC3B|nr:PQQ-dependent sugar dehydrogenase [Thermithiobacillus tepidarius]
MRQDRAARWGRPGYALLGLLCLAPMAAAQETPRLGLEAVATRGLQSPVYVTHAGDGSGRLFILEQPGRIRIVQQGRLLPTPFLDITKQVRAGGEQGLLGLAFHPKYRQNGRYFINYTRAPDGATVVAEYRVSDEANVSATEERRLLVVPQPYPNHNGGMIEFGPDGFLYIALGDGGAGGDPGNRAQNRRELLGKLLRIDVDRGKPYGIPADNPFARGGGRAEIFAYGLRNPWRFSFDRKTGQLWAADVGQDAWEEIDVIKRGGNYGWRIMEGKHCFPPRRGCSQAGLQLPVAEYGHEKGRCSITGGYVYRGSRVPALTGIYLYADYCSGEIFGLRDGRQRVLLPTKLRITSFGQDEQGEVYVVGHEGTVHRLSGGASR